MYDIRYTIVCFELHTTLVSEYNVGEVVAKVHPGKVQPLLLIDCTYELAIRAASEGPPQCSPTTENSS